MPRSYFAAAALAIAGGVLTPSVRMNAQTFLRPADINALPSKPANARIAYGTDSLQFADLRLPNGKGPFPVAIVIHGGCWVHAYADVKNSAALSDALRDAGVATWNVEYRRLDDPGGGWPGTLLDVGAGADALRAAAKNYPLDLKRVVAVGHSAGGQLALWLAARHKLPKTSELHVDKPLRLSAAIALGGPGDLYDFASYPGPCGEGTETVEKYLGGSAEAYPNRWRDASPSSFLPLGVPQVMLAGEFDKVMPREHLDAYAAKARVAGDSVEVFVVPGAAHHEVMSPHELAWSVVRDAVLRALHVTVRQLYNVDGIKKE
ncbi:MAG: alpha/beta hydrolase [Gemmatimonadaceae bacterium]